MELLNHTAKEQIVKEYLKKFSIDTFIETGTYEGLMALATAPYVKQVYTIELDEKLHDFAQRNLKDNENVCEYHGDSGELLPQILSDISVPRLFWLDAHYSGGVTAKGETNTPILKELEAILTAPYDQLTVILIDDAREYVGKNDYPTQGQLKDMIHKVHPDWVFEVKDDIIRIHPKADFISMSTLGSFGQFGNQLFQYATLKACARCHNLRLEIPEDWIGRKVFLECNDDVISQVPREQKTIEPGMPLDTIDSAKNCDVKGYLQYHTSNYNKEHFRSLFRYKPELKEGLDVLLKEVRAEASILVAIHIRRGDYNIPSRSHNIAPTQWYLDWLKANWDNLDNPILFVASDDIDKVRDDFKAYNPQTFKGKNFITDHYILANADILLTSNSTFSFTAAMLNEKCKSFRPDFEQKKLVSFDPWDSEPVLTVEKPVSDKPLKLHLGCGNQRHEGFINIDCKKTPATDLICDIRQLPFDSDSIDEIECYHVFEHFPVCLHTAVSDEYGEKYALLIDVLKEWRRVLKKYGRLIIEMPDLDKTFEAYLKADEAEKERLLISVYGSYRGGDDTDIHRWGANNQRLAYMLDKAGFRVITFPPAQDYHVKDCPCLRVEAIK